MVSGNSYLNAVSDFEKALPNVQNETVSRLLERVHKKAIYTRSDRKNSYFNPDEKRIKLSKAAFSSTVAHELFHQIDFYNDISKSGMSVFFCQYLIFSFESFHI